MANVLASIGARERGGWVHSCQAGGRDGRVAAGCLSRRDAGPRHPRQPRPPIPRVFDSRPAAALRRTPAPAFCPTPGGQAELHPFSGSGIRTGSPPPLAHRTRHQNRSPAPTFQFGDQDHAEAACARCLAQGGARRRQPSLRIEWHSRPLIQRNNRLLPDIEFAMPFVAMHQKAIFSWRRRQ